MKERARLATAAALLLPLFLSGCQLFPTTRKLPIPKEPLVTKTAAPEELVAELNARWAALESLNATVEIQFSVLHTKKGVANDSTTVRAHILMRKPELLRVYGQVPVLGTRLFDMASDARNFTLFVPHYNKAYKGSNTIRKKSANQLENIRPGVFYDAMVVRGLSPDDLYSVTSETLTVEDKARKHFYAVPQYVLTILQRKPGSAQLVPLRVVRFHRDDLLPYQQDTYDSEGNLEMQVFYSAYQDFGGSRYPGSVVILRPLDEYQATLTVDKVVENMKLTDDQFVVSMPEGTAIQNLE